MGDNSSWDDVTKFDRIHTSAIFDDADVLDDSSEGGSVITLSSDDIDSTSSGLPRNQAISRRSSFAEEEASVVVLSAEVPTSTVLRRFQSRLAKRVHGYLEKALHANGQERTVVLEDLFNNLMTEVEDVVEARLRDRGDSQDASPADNRFYYELLSEYYEQNPAEAAELQPVCVSLWSNVFFPSIFALLFYRWLFKADTELPLNRFNVFLKGTNRLFWYDMEGMSYCFFNLYRFLKEEVLLCSEQPLDRLPTKVVRDVLSLTAKFFFYYDEAPTLVNLLERLSSALTPLWARDPEGWGFNIQDGVVQQVKQAADSAAADIQKDGKDLITRPAIPSFATSADTLVPSSTPSSLFPTPPANHFRPPSHWLADLFVAEAVRQVQAMKNETVLLGYLKKYIFFKDVPMGMTAMNQLQVSLYAFTNPGGPLFAPRKVRQAARAVMDKLFPFGRRTRALINVLFRLLHPYYWPSSVFHWLSTRTGDLVHALHSHFTDKPLSAQVKQMRRQSSGQRSWWPSIPLPSSPFVLMSSGLHLVSSSLCSASHRITACCRRRKHTKQT